MILATAGHIDHGKTALVRALTGIDADRLPEEKRRGMTIDLGFAYAGLPDGGEIGFVDVPGHERFLPNMLAGVLGIDRVLLVVAADDGPRPQTHEHLDILALIGVGEITGVVTKIDRVPPPRAAAVVSGLFRMPIDRAFTLPGIGLIVTGTVAAGVVAPGDRVVLSPRGVELRVRGLHARNRPVARAVCGERCAVNLAGAIPEGAGPRRGDWLVDAARHAPSGRLDLWLRASPLAPAPLKEGLPVHLHLGTADVVGRLAVLSGAPIAPGESGFAQVDLAHPIGALCGDRVVLRDHAARHTLAGGRVVDPFAPRRGRRTPARLAVLAAMAEPDPALALDRRLALEGIVDLARFALARNLAPDEFSALFADDRRRPVGRPPAYAVSAQRFAALGDVLIAALARFHQDEPDRLGPSRLELSARLAGEAPEAVLAEVLAALAAAGRVRRTGPYWHLSEHRPRLAAADERLWARLYPLLAAGGLRPPRVRELAAALCVETAVVARCLARAERCGRVAKVTDNRYFLPQTLAALADIACELAAASPGGAFTAAAFRDRSGVGRNLTIEILEFLDKIGATRRVGDVRMALRGGGALFE